MSLEDISTPTDIQEITVLLSGIVISKTSGEAVVIGDVAGALAEVNNANVDGESVGTQRLETKSILYGYEEDGDEWNRIRVNKSGQGALVVASSGQDYILAKAGVESGHVSIQSGKISISSGLMGILSGHVAIQSGRIALSSGTVHVMSGQLISKVSGEVLKVQAPSAILAGYTVIGAQSGGTALSSGAVVHVAIKSVSRSGDMWTGPPGVLSGAGYLLEQFDEVPYDIDNLNKIYVIAEISGVRASWTAEVE